MAISENKMQIVIDNYFKSECDINTSIRSAFEKGFRIGVKKASSIQSEQRWIPVSERLPEEYGIYLITKEEVGWNMEACKTIDIAYFETDWHKADKVLAWMPLPEPYRGEGGA